MLPSLTWKLINTKTMFEGGRSGPKFCDDARMKHWLGLSLLVCAAAAVLLPLTPWFRPFPNRDSGLFLYVGDQWLSGKIPYLDVWDHKPPGIFYVDAVALLLGGHGLWGLWIIEFATLMVSVLCCFQLLKRHFPPGAALPGSAAMVACLPFVIQDGNITEEFGVALQFVAVWFFLGRERSFGNLAVCGAAVGACGLLKPNLIGVGLVMMAFILADARKTGWNKAAINVLGMTLGGIALVAAALTPFVLHHAIPQLWNQVFDYNSVYVQETWRHRADAALTGCIIFTRHNGAFLLVMVGAAAFFGGLLNRSAAWVTDNILTRFCIIWLPVEVGLSSLSGRWYAHYYMPWLAPMAPLLTCGGCVLWVYFKRSNFLRFWGRYLSEPFVFTLIGLLFLLPTFRHAAAQIWHLYIDQPPDGKLAVEYLQKNSNGSDKVLIWGAETTINFVARREAPSLYAYQYPLFTTNYTTPQMVARFLQDLQRARPQIIIDTSPGDELVPPIDAAKRRGWKPVLDYYSPPAMETVYSFIESHYQKTGTIGLGSWPVYRLIE